MQPNYSFTVIAFPSLKLGKAIPQHIRKAVNKPELRQYHWAHLSFHQRSKIHSQGRFSVLLFYQVICMILFSLTLNEVYHSDTEQLEKGFVIYRHQQHNKIQRLTKRSTSNHNRHKYSSEEAKPVRNTSTIVSEASKESTPKPHMHPSEMSKILLTLLDQHFLSLSLLPGAVLCICEELGVSLSVIGHAWYNLL